MKFYKSTPAILAASLLAASAMVSCSNDFDYPPVIVPVATIQPNTTIAAVKAAYWKSDRNYADTILYNKDGSHVIISGRVTSSDESGNIYKSLIIQDETAALAMSIDNSSLYESYKVGQEIVIDLTEMYIGKYNGLQQLGLPKPYGDGYEVSFMTSEFFQEHAQVNGLPEPDAIAPTVTTIADINALSTDEELQTWQSRLVRLDNVSWVDGGVADYCDPDNNTNRTLIDADGNEIIVRNSKFASFAYETMPAGTGSVIAILSYYGTGWQLLLRNTADCIGFDAAEGPGSGVNTGDPSEANTTIAQLKAQYWQSDMNYCQEIGQTADGKDIVITGRVTSSDQSGNIFKTLYIQDETDAIAFSIDGSKLYSSYPIGQQIVVNITGLHIGKYAGLMQIGAPGEYNGTPQVDRMALTTFRERTKLAGAPNASAVTPIVTTISAIAGIGSSDAENLQKWQARLVTFNDVHFQNGGTQAFVVEGKNTNQNLLDAQGKSIVVRTSSFATYASTILPAGTGSVTGLLSYFNGTWQLMLNNADGCTGFDGQSVTPEPPVTGTATFKKVDKITSGKSYVLVYDGKVSIPIKETFTYGYLYVEDPASVSGDQLTTSAANGIVITADGSAFTMCDSYGRYLSMDGSHNSSFQLYTAAQNGSTWSISFDADGRASIVNVLMPTCTVGWKSQYSNIAPATSPDGLPFLYEKVD